MNDHRHPQVGIQTTSEDGIAVRPLEEADLPHADHVMRLAFGTFLGLPEPTQFLGDADLVHSRWHANPGGAFAAEADGRLVGSNFATNWGSVGFFGPLTTHPSVWDRRVGTRLVEPAMACFEKWGTTHAGLFTFPNSAKHHGLYQKFGFWPQFLTMVMAKPVGAAVRSPGWTSWSELPEDQRGTALQALQALTDRIYPGLDVTVEVELVARRTMGDTVFVFDEAGLAAAAVCHCGPGTEAGGGTCYVKFGAARPGLTAARHFDRLLDACEELAAARGLTRLSAGVNTARHAAYRRMLGRGMRAGIQGVVMQRNNQVGYNRPDVYLIDDWR
ncbi:MAG TPA: GNAT family N-acetyltransferase [Noviherbaspirillum sp.]|jgi:GNAT superfamily N-acetyltransferase|uniref:GNAT family N-acetyltransferase n=1 Tax=Noviherbaspirillum sp. TaxID=1926288 RepID=UPI002F93DFB8